MIDKHTADNTETISIEQFLGQLFRKYKVLNRLGHQETDLFRFEVMQLLTGSQEGKVDDTAYRSIVEEIGIANFVLEVLATVLNRNPLRTHSNIGKRIVNISDELQKKQRELVRKAQLIDRREEKLSQMEHELCSRIKEKSVQMEKQIISRLLAKQAQIKKVANTALNNLKVKQKVLTQKHLQLKTISKRMTELQAKEKALSERSRIIERKDKQAKCKQQQNIVSSLSNELNHKCQQNKQLITQIKDLQRKIKNLELAYRKVKSELGNVAAKQEQKKRQPAGRLEDLEISQICSKHENESQVRQLQMLIDQAEEDEQVKFQQKQSNSQQKQIAPCFKFQFQKPTSIEQIEEIPKLVQYIRRLHPETDEDKKTLVKGTLEGLLIKCQQNSYDRSLTLATLELMLAMLEQGDQYPAVIEYLKATSLPFLQKAYLQHETITEIVEASTLILSRINIAFTNIQLETVFVKALQVRLRCEDRLTFLCINIKSLLG